MSFRDVLLGRKQGSFDKRELHTKVNDAVSGVDLDNPVGYGDKFFLSTKVSCAVCVGMFGVGRFAYVRHKLVKAKKPVFLKRIFSETLKNTIAFGMFVTPIWLYHQPEQMVIDYIRTYSKIYDMNKMITSPEELEYAGFDVLGSKMTRKEYNLLMYKLSTGQIVPGHALRNTNQTHIQDLKSENFGKKS